MTDKIVDSSRKLALALGTKGLVNIQYLIWENELYVIEVNPRCLAHRAVHQQGHGQCRWWMWRRASCSAHRSKTSGYGTGLHPIPPY